MQQPLHLCPDAAAAGGDSPPTGESVNDSKPAPACSIRGLSSATVLANNTNSFPSVTAPGLQIQLQNLLHSLTPIKE